MASLFFYSWWSISYLPLIILSILFNYTIGRLLIRYKQENRFSTKTLLIVGIIGNLSLLGYFKYVDFFIENINLTLSKDISLFQLTLPLAISFFTLQQIAYLVDVYNNDAKKYNLLNYSLFVTFFPQLIAGPIVYHKEMMRQFNNSRNKLINYRNISLGLFIFSIGLFKKVVIADSFSVWVENGFDKKEMLNFFESWMTSLSYTFQLYFDFSGYADIAVGVAFLFNIKLPANFNSPYKAKNIKDFWRRWHITLGRFLKHYIYIPLGGNKMGNIKTYNNLMITFIIGGLWHGANWTFVFWGFLHGLALVTHHLWGKLQIKLNPIVAWIITFNFINITWVFFRAKEFEDAIKVLKGMFRYDLISKVNLIQLLLVILSIIIVLYFKNSFQLYKKGKHYILKGIFSGFLIFLSIMFLFIRGEGEFLYFQF